MTRQELEQEIEVIVVETATLPKKDRDRLIDSLVSYLLDELGVEIDDEEDEESEED